MSWMEAQQHMDEHAEAVANALADIQNAEGCETRDDFRCNVTEAAETLADVAAQLTNILAEDAHDGNRSSGCADGDDA